MKPNYFPMAFTSLNVQVKVSTLLDGIYLKFYAQDILSLLTAECTIGNIYLIAVFLGLLLTEYL